MRVKPVSFQAMVSALDKRSGCIFFGVDDKNHQAQISETENPDRVYLRVGINLLTYQEYKNSDPTENALMLSTVNRGAVKSSLCEFGFGVNKSVWRNEKDFPDIEAVDPGFIYVIRLVGTDLYKVGLSKNPTNRIKTFSVEFPIETRCIALLESDNMNCAEYYAHALLMKHHVKGEWFRMSKTDLLRLIDLLSLWEEKVVNLSGEIYE